MPGLLNLTEADESGFDPLPAGAYVCEVFEVSVVETKGGEDAKLPKGTPMLKVQWKVLSNRDRETEIFDDEGKKVKLENRRLFGQNVIPPKDIDGKPYEHYEMLNGQILRLFKSLGYDEKQIRNPKGFDPDFDDMVGRQALVTVGRDMEYGTNPVKGVKPLEGEPVAGLL
jgi:hypothetical protein